MFGWLEKKDWRTSPAHLLLLSKFLKGDSPTRYRDADYWEAALKEKPAKAIENFIKEEMLESAELPELLNYKFKGTELKAMLKEKGLKVSGRKEELIQRLIDNCANEMLEATKDIVLYRCTITGMQLAESYIEGEKVKREATEQEILNLLAQEEFSKAVHVLVQYEAVQVFPRGLGLDWKSYDETSDVEFLKMIFNSTPVILKPIEENRLRQLHLASGMMRLWGTNTARRWLPDGFDTGIHLDGDTACRMFVFYALHLRNMKKYKEAGIRTVKVSGPYENSCSECQKIKGKIYLFDDVPEIPYAKCTCESGCRCTIGGVVDF
jgi:hypothetical protein